MNTSNEPTPQQPELLDIKGVAALLKIPEASAYKLAHANKIPGGVKVGKHWRFDEETIRDWIKGGRKEPHKKVNPTGEADVRQGGEDKLNEPKALDSRTGQFFSADEDRNHAICLLHDAIKVSKILRDPTEVSGEIFPPGVIYEISNDANEKSKGLAVSIKFVLESEFKKLRLQILRLHPDPNGENEFYTNSVKLLDNGDKSMIYVSKENLDMLDITSVSRMNQSLQSMEQAKGR